MIRWTFADVVAIHDRHSVPLNPLYANVTRLLRVLINDRSFVALSGWDAQNKPLVLLLSVDNNNDGLPDGGTDTQVMV